MRIFENYRMFHRNNIYRNNVYRSILYGDFKSLPVLKIKAIFWFLIRDCFKGILTIIFEEFIY